MLSNHSAHDEFVVMLPGQLEFAFMTKNRFVSLGTMLAKLRQQAKEAYLLGNYKKLEQTRELYRKYSHELRKYEPAWKRQHRKAISS